MRMNKSRPCFSLIKSCLFIGISFIILGMNNVKVYADSSESAYSVSANLPSFQNNKKLSYFDLLLKPSQKEQVSIHIKNNSQEKATYLVDVNNAVTNSNGVIDYGQKNVKKDVSADYVLNQLVSPETQEVILQPGEAKDIPFQIKMPKQAFTGIILGGIHITKKDTLSKKVSGTAIRNKYAYVIGMKLETNTNKVTPDLKLLAARPGLENSYTTIFANVQNPTPTIISKVSFDATITKKGSKKVLYKSKKENMSIAPNTNFNFPIGLTKEKITPGNYTVTIDAKEGTTNKTWHLTTDFEIQAKKAEKINKKAVLENKGVTYLPIIIVVGLLLIGIILVLSYKLLKQKK